MQPRTVEERLTILEQQMQVMKEFPAGIERVESQILQLRSENQSESSAIRDEMRAGFAAVRSETTEEFATVRSEMAGEFAAVRSEMAEGFGSLRSETAAGLAAVRSEMADLREDLREDIRVGVDESQNLTKLFHVEAMQAIASVDAALRRDVVSRLDRLLELQRPGDSSA